jgi:membrane-bound metal-dependent hydrolase YbcI (DUF457 family)
MWPPGHLGIGYCIAAGWSGWQTGEEPTDRTVQLCLVGSLLPDLVDKLLAWGLGILPGGRTLTHSLLVLVPLFATTLALARPSEQSEIGLLAGLSMLSHPVIDSIPALWDPATSARHLLWPLLAVETVERSPPSTSTVQELLLARLTTPWFLLELLVFVVAMVWWHRDGTPGLPAWSGESAD